MQVKKICKGKQYEGKHVAFENFACDNVVSCGDSYKAVYNEARKKGYSKPVLCFIPEKRVFVHV